eukprot:SAG31_NODE_43882_length_265_cov_0.626506_1_plen_33_part_10
MLDAINVHVESTRANAAAGSMAMKTDFNMPAKV